jgi:hypothetical protein
MMVMMMMVTIGSGGDDSDNDDGGVWFALLWRGWLNIYQNNPQWVGGLAAVGRIPLLSWWVCPLVEGVAKDLSKQLPMGVGALLRCIGLPFCLGWVALLWKGWLKIIQNNSQGSGSFASVNRFARLCWLVCSSVEGMTLG